MHSRVQVPKMAENIANLVDEMHRSRKGKGRGESEEEEEDQDSAAGAEHARPDEGVSRNAMSAWGDMQEGVRGHRQVKRKRSNLDGAFKTPEEASESKTAAVAGGDDGRDEEEWMGPALEVRAGREEDEYDPRLGDESNPEEDECIIDYDARSVAMASRRYEYESLHASSGTMLRGVGLGVRVAGEGVESVG